MAATSHNGRAWGAYIQYLADEFLISCICAGECDHLSRLVISPTSRPIKRFLLPLLLAAAPAAGRLLLFLFLFLIRGHIHSFPSLYM
jgi:hypothetical protein